MDNRRARMCCGICSDIVWQACYIAEGRGFCHYPVHVMVLNCTEVIKFLLTGRGLTQVGFIPLGFGDVLEDIDCVSQPSICDSWPVRTSSGVWLLEGAVLQKIISSKHLEKKRVLHQVMKYMPHSLFKCQDKWSCGFTSNWKVEYGFCCILFHLHFRNQRHVRYMTLDHRNSKSHGWVFDHTWRDWRTSIEIKCFCQL